MSSIAGVIRWAGDVDTDVVTHMLDTTPWRGAVTTMVSADGCAAFGSATLPSHACSMAVSGSVIVCAAGYIHRRELLADAVGVDSSSADDAALIAAAYARWGDACAERIDGEVSFAIWDGDARRLTLVRDRMGTRPLVFTRTRDAVAFGSDVQAVRALPGSHARVNELRIAQFLSDHFDDQRATFYEGVERVPAGTLATVTDAGQRARTYWQPARGERRGTTDEQDTNTFRTLFVEAVEQRMPADAAIGVLLSGGLDSSSVIGVAAAARATLGQSAPVAISGVFDSLPRTDEREWIDAMVTHTHVPAVQVRVDDASLMAHARDIVRCHDEPPWVPNLFIYWHGLLPATKAAGINVLLDGAEGDTVVSHGIARIHDLFWGLRWTALWREARALENGSATRAMRAILDLGIRPAIPSLARRIYRRTKREDQVVPVIASAALLKRTGMRERQRASERVHTHVRNDADAHWYGIMSGANGYVNEVLERTAAWHGIELQHPFYDHRLIEHCVGLAADRKLRHGQSRWILREAMRRYLPDKVRMRTDKADLSPNFRRALAEDADVIDATLEKRARLLEPYIDRAALGRAAARYRRTGRELDGLALWKAVMLAEWLAAADHNLTGTSNETG